MKPVSFFAVALLAVSLSAFKCEQQQQQVGARILRRVIKSTPTANNLTRVRLVSVRSPSSSAERGAVAEISSKEADHFGQRSSNDTQPQAAASKSTKPVAVASFATSASSTTTPSTTTSATEATSTTTAASPAKVSERQQFASANGESVEVLASAPSSWQMMSAVEAPAAAALIAAGTRRAATSSDLSSASSEESSLSTSKDFLRSSASASKAAYSQSSSISDTFSRLRQGKTAQQQQQSFFYPQQQRAQSKTSAYEATKTHWYQPTTSTSTTPRPAPIIQQVQEQQNEQYVEQQQNIEAAPLGQAEPFAFDFNTQDNSGNGQYRKEESDSNGVVRGSYGYTDANGIYRHVEYIADQNGFRANIKSNEPGLIGETQPASIKLDGGARSSPPGATSQRFSASSQTDANSSGGDWTSASNSADLALAPPDFESSHKAERIRAPRNFRN